MGTVNKKFVFLADEEGFVGNPGNADVLYGWMSAVGDPPGSLQMEIHGRKKEGVSYWEWSGTWEDLGVSPGDTVTQVRLNGTSTKCSQYDIVDACTIGPYSIYDSAGTTLIATLWAGRSPTGVEGSFTTTGNQTYQTVSSTYEASNTSINLRIYNSLDLGNDADAGLIVVDDNVSIDIDYDTSADVLTAVGITTTPVVETPSIGQIHVLDSIDIVANPVVESPLLEIVSQYAIVFNATTTLIHCGSDVSLDDLHHSLLTVEGWVRLDGWGELGGRFAEKNYHGYGWIFFFGFLSHRNGHFIISKFPHNLMMQYKFEFIFNNTNSNS